MASALREDAATELSSQAHPERAGRRLPGGLTDQGFVSRLSCELIEELVQSAYSVSYPTGSIMEPPTSSALALIVSGTLRYYISASSGRQLTIGYLGPGDVIGTINKRATTMVRFQVLTPTRALHLRADRVQALVGLRPEFKQALLDEATTALRHSYSVLAANAFTSVRARVARDIVERAKVVGLLRTGARVAVTQQALADATGSVREVVARTLRELSREGVLLTGAGTVTILDPDRLTHLAENLS
jgi:CRP/FNR family transcriptional regulator, cyclic AMP receptor protein